MIPAIRPRSSSRWRPGGSNPSKPSRNPRTSQPSFSAARTTPRSTAFNPGQSPPLVSTPIRGFIICATEESKSFLRVQHSPAGKPLIVELPATCEKLRPFTETVGAAEDDNDEVTRDHGRLCAFLDELGFP